MNTVLDDEVKNLLENVDLDTGLTEKETLDVLRDRPKLKTYLTHCSRARTYIFSLKKCGETDYTICLPKRLPLDIFERLNHLPDPTPDPNNEGHYAKFNDVYGTEIMNEYMPSLHITASKSHGIPFNPFVQYAKNTGLTVKCMECKRTPTGIFTQKSISIASEKIQISN